MLEKHPFLQKSMLDLDERSQYYKKGVIDLFEILFKLINSALLPDVLGRSEVL